MISSHAQKNFLDVNYIEVTGTSEMDVVPDMIYLKISIDEKDSKGKISINKQEKDMLEKLNSMGIDTKKDLSMMDFDSNFKWKKFGEKNIILSKDYQLLVHDGQTVSKVYTELENIGISNISILRLDHTKIVELRKEVRASAVKAAKEKAEYLTKAINQTIGKALLIEEVYNDDMRRYERAMMSNSYKVQMEYEDYESDINIKTIKIEFSMKICFELK